MFLFLILISPCSFPSSPPPPEIRSYGGQEGEDKAVIPGIKVTYISIGKVDSIARALSFVRVHHEAARYLPTSLFQTSICTPGQRNRGLDVSPSPSTRSTSYSYHHFPPMYN